MKLMLLVCSAAFILGTVGGDFFSSVHNVYLLLRTQRNVARFVNEYINLQEQRMDKLRMLVDTSRQEVAEAKRDVEEYISSPINNFLLIRRLVVDWHVTKAIIRDVESKETVLKSVKDFKKTRAMPTESDLIGAGHGILRLQQAYKLDTKVVAQGKLKTSQSVGQLTASDCFMLGHLCQQTWNPNTAVTWFGEGFDREGKEDLQISKSDRMENLLWYAEGLFNIGNVTQGRKIINKVLALEPNNEQALTLKSENQDRVDFYQEEVQMPFEELRLLQKYEALCRNDFTIPLEISSKLKCRYRSKGHPYIRIAPFKVEEVYPDPKVVLIRDFIDDSEIEAIKNMTAFRMPRARVIIEGQEEGEESTNRLSTSGWISDDSSPVIAKVSRRVADAAGFSLDEAELLQIGNYGVGGHYLPHFDFFEEADQNLARLQEGNRLGTGLIYLSHVEEGGRTAFPILRFSVPPEKGTMLLWHNLLPNGVKDRRTLHSACPVVVGNKWVSNKWFHYSGQIFNKPCKLKEDLAPEVDLRM